LTTEPFQKNLTIYKIMDYIDRYKRARVNGFASDEDKKSQRDFPIFAKRDVKWARDNNLIRAMSFEEFMETQSKQRYTEITEEMRKVIVSDLDIPAWILGMYYDIPTTTVQNLRSKYKAKANKIEEGDLC